MSQFNMTKQINNVTFTSDLKHLCVAHTSGYTLYKTADMYANKRLISRKDQEKDQETQNCLLIRKQGNLLATVTQHDTRVVSLWKLTQDKREMIYKQRFSKSVVGVEMNKDRLIVCVEDTIYIFTLHGSKLLATLQETQFSNRAIIDLTQKAGVSLIAYPTKADTGVVCFFDAMRCVPVVSVNASDSHVACVKFNPQSNVLATASCTGTVIRVFGVPGGEKLFEFRRGMSAVKIQSLSFSEDSKYMCSTSNSQTIHVFRLRHDQPKSPIGSWYESFSSLAAYVPSQLDYSICAERSFKQGFLSQASDNNVGSIIRHGNQYHIIVATNAGCVYCFLLENEQDQLCLMKQYRIATKPFVNKSVRKTARISKMESIEEKENDANIYIREI